MRVRSSTRHRSATSPLSPRRARSTSSKMAPLIAWVPRLVLSIAKIYPYVQLAAQVLDHSIYFQERLRASLATSSIPPHVLSLPAHLQKPPRTQLPTPIIPLLTPRARALSAHLLAHGVNARPISWPTVPKGADRVRVCLHAGNTRAELDMLIDTAIAWAAAIAREEGVGKDRERYHIQEDVRAIGGPGSGGAFLQSKL